MCLGRDVLLAGRAWLQRWWSLRLPVLWLQLRWHRVRPLPGHASPAGAAHASVAAAARPVAAAVATTSTIATTSAGTASRVLPHADWSLHVS